jgi:UTP--glucose-1-phosphate uridylyltransferase
MDDAEPSATCANAEAGTSANKAASLRMLLQLRFGEFDVLARDRVVFLEFQFLSLLARVALFHVEKARIRGGFQLHENGCLLCHNCLGCLRRAIYAFFVPCQALGAHAILIDFETDSRDITLMSAHKPIRKVVFPVGGLGTRFLPATKSMPKEMLPVVDKPLIHYAFEEARAAGIEQFIFVTGRNKDAIENHFDRAYELERTLDEKQKTSALAATADWLPTPGSVIYLRQQEPLGLGHAVWCARNVVGDEPFAVILADDLVHSAATGCLRQMIEAHAQVPTANMAAVMEVPREKTASYGILKLDGAQGKLVKALGLVEKPQPDAAPSTTSIIGRYILQPSIFGVLERQARGAGGEIQLTDALNSQIPTTDFYGYHFDGTRYDCGEVTGYIEANVALALARPELAPSITQKLAALVG